MDEGISGLNLHATVRFDPVMYLNFTSSAAYLVGQPTSFFSDNSNTMLHDAEMMTTRPLHRVYVEIMTSKVT